MSTNKKEKSNVAPIYSFAAAWVAFSFIFPPYRTWGLIFTAVLSLAVSLIVNAVSSRKRRKAEEKAASADNTAAAEEKAADTQPAQNISPEAAAILKEGKVALGEMGRLYAAIQAPEIREKINEIMRITDKIVQDAVEDPSDIPQIKKFMNYYLPTTIKLLNTYDRMSAQGIQGENLGKSMQSINDMLDEAIAAFKKRLDSLFANQALDIETDIKVMNTMLAREGLSGEKDFDIHEQKGQTT